MGGEDCVIELERKGVKIFIDLFIFKFIIIAMSANISSKPGAVLLG
jgi:hypothetical protein